MGSPKQAAFAKGMHVVYPAHGVGRVLDIAKQQVAGFDLELVEVEVERGKVKLRIPMKKVASSGLRPVIDADEARKVLATLEGKARRSRGLWARRAQDYEGKINSGDAMALAEVVRDLSRGGDDAEASYSERTIHETAVDRLVQELAVALDMTESETSVLVRKHLDKRPARAAGPASATDPEEDSEAA